MPQYKKIFAVASRCTGCKTCEIACAVAHSSSKTLFAAIFESPAPRHRIDVQSGSGVRLPVNCRQCSEPDCLFACKAGAVSRNPDNGQVTVNLDKCVGCWMCVMVCPFGAVVPDEPRGKALKCDLCVGRAEGPACVGACPTKALYYGTLAELEDFIKAG